MRHARGAAGFEEEKREFCQKFKMTRQNDFSCSDDNDSDQILLRLYRGPLPSERFSFQTEIHLCNQGLLSVPDYFLRFHFVGLRVLNLSGNSLRALPGIFQTKKLSERKLLHVFFL